MLTKLTIDMGLFVAIVVFAVIGAIVVALLFLYAIFGALDWTYHERHRKKHNTKCPDKVERD